jgi:predicted dehydrogenase
MNVSGCVRFSGSSDLSELRIALIGGGFMGKAHSLAYALAPLAEDLGVTVRKEVLVDVTADGAAAAAARLGWQSSSADWQEVVARPDIDIVDICTPPQLHEQIALAAIANGKHLFCEKPISNDVGEAWRMAAAAREAGVVTQVGFNYRHAPAIAFAKDLLDSGRLGVPLQFRASYLQEVGFWADPNRWRANRATGGSGTIGDIGSHVIDAAEYLMGDITRVAARLRSKAPGTDAGWLPEEVRLSQDMVDDGAVWIAEFESGALGTFSTSIFAAGRKNQYAFQFDGTKAAVEFDWNHREELRVAYVNEPGDHLGFRTILMNDSGWWRLAGLGVGYVDVEAIQMTKFLRAIVEGREAHPNFAEAAHVEQVVEALADSAASDTWIDVPACADGVAA